MLKDLIKLANHLDQRGLTKEANSLDVIIRKMASRDHIPDGRMIVNTVRLGIREPFKLKDDITRRLIEFVNKSENLQYEILEEISRAARSGEKGRRARRDLDSYYSPEDGWTTEKYKAFSDFLDAARIDPTLSWLNRDNIKATETTDDLGLGEGRVEIPQDDGPEITAQDEPAFVSVHDAVSEAINKAGNLAKSDPWGWYQPLKAQMNSICNNYDINEVIEALKAESESGPFPHLASQELAVIRHKAGQGQ